MHKHVAGSKYELFYVQFYVCVMPWDLDGGVGQLGAFGMRPTIDVQANYDRERIAC